MKLLHLDFACKGSKLMHFNSFSITTFQTKNLLLQTLWCPSVRLCPHNLKKNKTSPIVVRQQVSRLSSPFPRRVSIFIQFPHITQHDSNTNLTHAKPIHCLFCSSTFITFAFYCYILSKIFMFAMQDWNKETC